eukprot:TRINITY_DN19922_c0_g1_i1.p1 TRINITY_DN19922_c0_g1~~TRINITY_DN19922_c0_g1_i1.p1  ORF type:complete len:1266 (+),score=399.71 TRINITY_DN19922_c0_g1_i1:88-3885(+)
MAGVAFLQRMRESAAGRPLEDLKGELRSKLDHVKGRWGDERVAALDYGVTLKSVTAARVGEDAVAVRLHSEVDGLVVVVAPADPAEAKHFATAAAVLHAANAAGEGAAAPRLSGHHVETVRKGADAEFVVALSSGAGPHSVPLCLICALTGTPEATAPAERRAPPNRLPPVAADDAPHKTVSFYKTVRRVEVTEPPAGYVDATVAHVETHREGAARHCTAYLQLTTGREVPSLRLLAYTSRADAVARARGRCLSRGAVQTPTMSTAVKVPELVPGCVYYVLIYNPDEGAHEGVIKEVVCPSETPASPYTPLYIPDPAAAPATPAPESPVAHDELSFSLASTPTADGSPPPPPGGAVVPTRAAAAPSSCGTDAAATASTRSMSTRATYAPSAAAGAARPRSAGVSHRPPRAGGSSQQRSRSRPTTTGRATPSRSMLSSAMNRSRSTGASKRPRSASPAPHAPVYPSPYEDRPPGGSPQGDDGEYSLPLDGSDPGGTPVRVRDCGDGVDAAALGVEVRKWMAQAEYSPSLVRALRRLFVDHAARSGGREWDDARPHQIDPRTSIRVGTYRQKSFLRFMGVYHEAVSVRNDFLQDVHPVRLANPAAGFFVEPRTGKAKGSVPGPMKSQSLLASLSLLCGGNGPWDLTWYSFLLLLSLETRHVNTLLYPLRHVLERRGVEDAQGFFDVLTLLNGRYPPLDSLWKLFVKPRPHPSEVLFAMLPRKQQLALMHRAGEAAPEHRHRAHHKLVKARVILSLRLYGQTLLALLRRYFILFLSYSFTKRTRRMNQQHKGLCLSETNHIHILRRYYDRMMRHHEWCKEYFDTVKKSKDLMWRTNEELVHRYWRKLAGLMDVRRKRKIFTYRLGTLRIMNDRRVVASKRLHSEYYHRWLEYMRARKKVDSIQDLMAMWDNTAVRRKAFRALLGYAQRHRGGNKVWTTCRYLMEHSVAHLLQRYFRMLLMFVAWSKQRRRRDHAWHFFNCFRRTIKTEQDRREELDESMVRENEYAASMIQRRWRERKWCGWHLVHLLPINSHLRPLPRHRHYLVRRLQAFVRGGLFYPVSHKHAHDFCPAHAVPFFLLARVAKAWNQKVLPGSPRAKRKEKTRREMKQGLMAVAMFGVPTVSKTAASKIQKWWAPLRKRREQEKFVQHIQLLEAVQEATKRRLSAELAEANQRSSSVSSTHMNLLLPPRDRSRRSTRAPSRRGGDGSDTSDDDDAATAQRMSMRTGLMIKLATQQAETASEASPAGSPRSPAPKSRTMLGRAGKFTV